MQTHASLSLKYQNSPTNVSYHRFELNPTIAQLAPIVRLGTAIRKGQLLKVRLEKDGFAPLGFEGARFQWLRKNLSRGTELGRARVHSCRKVLKIHPGFSP
jgi:hypothetical protein